MQALSMVFLIVGVIVAVVGSIGLIIAAFHESVLWGLGVLVIPIVGLIFVALHWQETKKPFLTNLAGLALIVVSAILSPAHQ